MTKEDYLVGAGCEHLRDDESSHHESDDEGNRTLLHAAELPQFPSQNLSNSANPSIIIRGGKKELERMVKAVSGNSANNRPYETMAFLQDETIAAEKLWALRMTNSNGLTSLFLAIRDRADCSVVKKMIDIGGKEFVMLSNPLGENSLHYAAICGASHDVFEALVDVGG